MVTSRRKHYENLKGGSLLPPSHPTPGQAVEWGRGEEREEKLCSSESHTGLGEKETKWEQEQSDVTVNHKVSPQNRNWGPTLRTQSVCRTWVTRLQVADEPPHRWTLTAKTVPWSRNHPCFAQKLNAWSMITKQPDEWVESLEIGSWMQSNWKCVDQMYVISRWVGLPVLLCCWRSPTPRILDPQTRAPPCSPLPGENKAIQV